MIYSIWLTFLSISLFNCHGTNHTHSEEAGGVSTTANNEIKFPESCDLSECIFTIQWSAYATFSNFTITTKLAKTLDTNSAWTAIAFSKDKNMGDDNVVLAANANGEQSIKHYYNVGMFKPDLLYQENPTVGLETRYFLVEDGQFVYSFLRNNTYDVENYFNLNESFYVLVAQGEVDENGEIAYHIYRSYTGDLITFL